MKTRNLLLALTVLAMAAPAPAGEMAQRMRGAPTFVLLTVKSPDQLEYCTADALSSMGDPAAFHDGAQRTIVSAFGFGKALGTVEISAGESGGGTVISAWIVGKGWDDRMRVAISRCL